MTFGRRYQASTEQGERARGIVQKDRSEDALSLLEAHRREKGNPFPLLLGGEIREKRKKKKKKSLK